MRKQAIQSVRIVAWALLIAALMPVNGLLAQDDAEGGLDRAVLLHDSRDDLYRTPTGPVPTNSAVTLRFRTAARDADGVTVRVWDDRAQTQTLLPMSVIATTPDGYDLWEATLDTGKTPTIYWYRFLVSRGDQTVYYEDDTRPGADGVYFPANEGGPGVVYDESPDLSYQLTVYDPAFYTPEWMRNAVVYQIFPDRFRNGDPSNDPADDSLEFYDGLRSIFHETWNEPPVDPRQPGEYTGRWNVDFFGGDLAGIIEKLDYLQDLGVTALYLNPIFAARSNHRYDTADFKALDPLLGDLDTFQTLVAEAEARGMALILDGVFNHLSSDSAFFDRYGRYEEVGACESLDSPYRNWFFFVPPKGEQPSPCVDNPQGATYYVSWAGYDSIPKLNSDNAGVRLYFFVGRNSVVATWGRAGIGGWRLDVGGDIDLGGPASDYWEGFRNAVRNANPEGVIIGEEWGNATRWLLGNEWDSVMNYQLRRGILGFVREEDFTDNDANGDRIIHALTPSQLDGFIQDIASDYPPMANHAMMNLLGSHDTSRLLFVAGDMERQKLAALLQFALPGAPTIYYGDEIALDAPSVSDNSTLQDDPYNRAPYPWPDAAGDHYGPPDEDMLAFYQALAALRHANPALREGAMITLLADDATGVYAFLRLDEAAGNAALVVANNGEAAQTVTLDVSGLLPEGLAFDPAFAQVGEARTVPINVGGILTGELRLVQPVEPAVVTDGALTVTVGALSGNIWAGTRPAPFQAPEPPAAVTAEEASGSVTVTWDAVPGAAGYRVYRSPVAAGGFAPVSDVLADASSFVDETTTDGYRYFYAVASVSADGLIGPLSASVPAVPSAPISEASFAPEAMPTEVTLAYGATTTVRAAVRIPGATEADGPAVGVRAEAALLAAAAAVTAVPAWTPMQYAGDEGGADVYEVALPLSAAGEFAHLARFSSDAGETWTVVALPDGTYPPLTVIAPADSEAPAPPAAAEILQVSLAGVIVTWEDSPAEDVAAYRVYRTFGGETVLAGEVLADAENRFADRAVSAGNTYAYAVSAVDTALNESESVAAGEATVQRRGIPVTFIVTVPDYTKEGKGDVYIAGDFGTKDLPNWDPAGIVMTQVDDQHWTVTLELPESAAIQYKYVRGTWNAVEKGPECEEIANRTLTVTVPEGASELIVDSDIVAKWRDLDKCG
ncbi:MAG: alpha-amylase family glycosyl hydrolase [Chloroflexota bacterium]